MDVRLTIEDVVLLIEALTQQREHFAVDASREVGEALAARVSANVAGMIEMQPLTQRLRETLAERYYRGEITSSALTERLNLERQEAADEIERQSARVLALEQERRGARNDCESGSLVSIEPHGDVVHLKIA